MQNPCAEMYAGWLKQDSDELDAIRGCMENCADNICATVRRRSIVILLSPYTENRIRKPMPVVNYRNGKQTTDAAWSVRRYSKRKAELPTMSRYFLHFGEMESRFR